MKVSRQLSKYQLTAGLGVARFSSLLALILFVHALPELLHLSLALAPVPVLQVAVLQGVVVPRTARPLYRTLVRIFLFWSRAMDARCWVVIGSRTLMSHVLLTDGRKAWSVHGAYLDR